MFESDNLQDWLDHIERLHSKPIDMGLERMHMMVARMGISFAGKTVFTVGGTNGKGSTCAMLESICRAAGYTTGMHTSPHLLRINERCVVNGREVSDERLMAGFREVEQARGETTLSYFEYTALAILKIFQEEALDVVILEIGLGGRLDAINTIDAGCSVISTVGIDHVAFLGNTREAVGLEKAHIYRPGCPAVCADPDVPSTVAEYAAKIGADPLFAGRDWTVTVNADTSFDFAFRGETLWTALPEPALRGTNQYRNAGGVLAALAAVREKLPVDRSDVVSGLRAVRLTARFERIAETPVPVTIDVGHNPQAALVLRDNVARDSADGETRLAVFGMLADKDMESVSKILAQSFDAWYVASLTGPRAATAEQLQAAMLSGGVPAEKIRTFGDVASAIAAARADAEIIRNESGAHPVKIYIFGSFVTVTAALDVFAAEGLMR